MTCDHGIPVGSCYTCDWEREAASERRAGRMLATLVVLCVGAVIAVILAGCDGAYPLMPAADAGAADAGLPLCVVPDGDALLEHGCNVDGCEQCGAETPDGYKHVDLGGCRSPRQSRVRCVVSCAECGS